MLLLFEVYISSVGIVLYKALLDVKQFEIQTLRSQEIYISIIAALDALLSHHSYSTVHTLARIQALIYRKCDAVRTKNDVSVYTKCQSNAVILLK